MQPISTYVLMGLGYGLQIAGVLMLISLRQARPPLEMWAVGSLVALVFIGGSVAIALIGTQAAKRLARQLIDLRASASVASR
jgi:hypothetical protein